LNRVTTPLWWADASFALVQSIYQEARLAVPRPKFGVEGSDLVFVRQGWLRRVSAEFHRRLREARIFVEGASDV
jgi:hypothetical protein